MTPDEALAAVAGVEILAKPAEAGLEAAGLTTGVLVLLAALWSLLAHYICSRSQYLNESGTACLLGLAAGVALLAWRDTTNAGLVNGLLRFNSAAFFTYLLPPVIFYAGLSVEQRLFFSNLPSILSFGVLGTLLSFVLMSAALYSLGGTTFGLDAQDCLALGAVFSATDSVAVLGLLDPRTNPQLFSLVFGEGIVNDATSVVLLGALARMAHQQEHLGGSAVEGGAESGSLLGLVLRLMWNFGYLLLTSTLLGFAAGVGVTAMLRGRVASQGPHHEVALVGLLSYLAYLGAEVLGLSAILSLFCCGATVSHFVLRNGAGGVAAAEDDPSSHRELASLGSDGGGSSELPSADVSTHGGGVSVRGDHVVNGGMDVENGDVGVRSRYGLYVPVATEQASSHGVGGSGDDGRGVLRVVTAPAKRLAGRAFGGGPGTCYMSPAGATTTINAFRSLSYVAEGLIFIYLGLDCLDPVRWKASFPGEVVWLVGILLFFLLAARAASVIPLSMLHNLYAPDHQRLSSRDMLTIWWSGLMRGAVSVALVYLNFDTLNGSVPLGEVIVAPHRFGGDGGGRRHHRRARGLLQAPSSMVPAAPAAPAPAAAGTGATANPVASAAMALAAALADADEESARQHATLIVATLLVVVASLLVVSTFTKPVLQAAMQADPRKPPLMVLSEALFDPWVDATWRLKVALDRSYRRWTNATSSISPGGDDSADAAAGASGTAATAPASGARRTSSTFISTHTIPMASLGNGGMAEMLTRGQSAPNVTSPMITAPKANPGLGAAGNGTSAVALDAEDFPAAAAATAAMRAKGASLQQRSGLARAAAALASPGPGTSSSTTAAVSLNQSASPSSAQLQHRAGRDGGNIGSAGTGGKGGVDSSSSISGAGAQAGSTLSPPSASHSSPSIAYDCSRGTDPGGSSVELARHRVGCTGSRRWISGNTLAGESEESKDSRSDEDIGGNARIS